MLDAIDRLTLLDLAMLLIVVLAVAVIIFAALWRQALDAAASQRKLAASNFDWACEGRNEVVALRRRLAHSERRHANLQERYADLTRRLLAKHYYEIEMNVSRRKQTG